MDRIVVTTTPATAKRIAEIRALQAKLGVEVWTEELTVLVALSRGLYEELRTLQTLSEEFDSGTPDLLRPQAA